MKEPRVDSLIPHSRPMVLLDSVECMGEEKLVARLKIGPDSLFVSGDGVPSWVGLEYLGQAVAAYMGAKARRGGQPVKVGFLVSSRRYDPAIGFFPLGSELILEVAPATPDDTGLCVFECRIECDGVQVVSANLNVYVPEDVTSFMKESDS